MLDSSLRLKKKPGGQVIFLVVSSGGGGSLYLNFIWKGGHPIWIMDGNLSTPPPPYT